MTRSGKMHTSLSVVQSDAGLPFLSIMVFVDSYSNASCNPAVALLRIRRWSSLIRYVGMNGETTPAFAFCHAAGDRGPIILTCRLRSYSVPYIHLWKSGMSVLMLPWSSRAMLLMTVSLTIPCHWVSRLLMSSMTCQARAIHVAEMSVPEENSEVGTVVGTSAAAF